jgi:hypothetical protein
VPDGEARDYFTAILDHAQRKTRDPVLFAKALAAWQERSGNDERAKPLLAVHALNLERLQRYDRFAKAAQGGDAQAAFELVLARLEMSELKLAEAKQAVAEAKVPDEQKKRADGWLLGLEVSAMLAAAKAPEDRAAAQAKVAEMFTAGKLPAPGMSYPYFSAVLMHAQRQKDAALMTSAFAAISKRVDGEPVLKLLSARFEKDLANLK